MGGGFALEPSDNLKIAEGQPPKIEQHKSIPELYSCVSAYLSTQVYLDVPGS